MVILLNILIALYNQAYTDITENAVDEYLALFSAKTLQFVRAPDENVFLPPFNLIEIFVLILPIEWWLPKRMYMKLNDWVMMILYLPLMVIIAFIETSEARHVYGNRARGEADDEAVEEWEEMQGELDVMSGEWGERVEKTIPNVEEEATVVGIRELKGQMDILADMVRAAGGLDSSEEEEEEEEEVEEVEGEGEGEGEEDD